MKCLKPNKEVYNDYIMADTKDNINTARRSHWSSYLPIVSAPFYTA